MLRNVNFGEYNSYDDLNCIVKSVTIGSAVPRTKYVDVPFRNGVLDLTEYYGSVKYANRKVTISVLFHGSTPMSDYSTLCNIIHGKRFNISLSDDDHGTFFDGRVTVGSYSTADTSCEIECACDPYRYVSRETIYEETFTGSELFDCECDYMPVVPTIETDQPITVVWDGNRYSINAGVRVIPDIVLTRGMNEIEIVAETETSVRIRYRNGGL